MNILFDQLPEAVRVSGREYEINTDFRSALRVIAAFEDNELTPYEKQLIMLANLFPIPPEDAAAACKVAVRFLDGGEGGDDDGDSASSPRLYSFSKDAGFIFSAFKQTHDIDLETVDMHWWKFLALFMDLGAETTFSALVGLRKRIREGTATKEERAAARNMGDLFDVPELDTRSLSEREAEAEFLRLVRDGERRRGQ